MATRPPPCLLYLWLVILISLLGLSLVFYMLYVAPARAAATAEGFANAFPGRYTTEEGVVYVYRSTLDREPTASELLRATNDIEKEKMTLAALRMRLLNSEEYARASRVQSNQLVPGLERSIQQRMLLAHIAALYEEERKATIPSDMVFPLRDLFVHFGMNGCTFRALLRHPNYFLFEREAQMTPNPTREGTLALLQKRFSVLDLEITGRTLGGCGVFGGGTSSIGNDLRSGTIVEGVIYGADGAPMAAAPLDPPTRAAPEPLARVPDPSKKPSAANATTKTPVPGSLLVTYPDGLGATTAAGTAPTAPKPAPAAPAAPAPAAPTDKVTRTVADRDTDMTDLMRRIQLEADRQFDKGRAAQALQTHYGGMVLRPEMAWAVPQPRPPVCLPYGPQAEVLPTIPSSQLLYGTPIPEATYNARVGSAVLPPVMAPGKPSA